jgi:hypothetical protein
MKLYFGRGLTPPVCNSILVSVSAQTELIRPTSKIEESRTGNIRRFINSTHLGNGWAFIGTTQDDGS